jgi:hypothetical protein
MRRLDAVETRRRAPHLTATIGEALSLREIAQTAFRIRPQPSKCAADAHALKAPRTVASTHGAAG